LIPLAREAEFRRRRDRARFAGARGDELVRNFFALRPHVGRSASIILAL
jgi:hypothetical protein